MATDETVTYPREHIAIVDLENNLVWGQQFAREACGCRMMIGLPIGSTAKEDLKCALETCDLHEAEMTRVLHTIKTMPPCDEEMGALFSRLLEEELRDETET